MKKKMRKIFAFCFLALLNGFVSGTVTASEPKSGVVLRHVVTGRVLDQSDGMPLPGVSVSVKGGQQGAITDQSGYFRIDNIAGNSAVVAVSCLGYASAEYPVSFLSGKPVALSIELQPGLVMGREVVVIGEQLKGQAKALNQQKNSDNITNIIAADQIGKFPDSNTGDALKRIPGISVFGDQGEARFAHIRGTEPRFNSVMINGERIPSAEAEGRSVQLDLVPADMIQTIEVNKTFTPDMDADAIGGSVNLITKVPSGKRISITAAGGANLIEETGGGRYQFAGTYGDRYLDGRLGVVVSASYYDTSFGSDDIEAAWDRDDDGKPLLDEFEIRTYEIQRIRRSLSAGLDYRFNENHILKFTGIYNWREDWENRYRASFKDLLEDTAEIVRQDKAGVDKNARLEDQRMMSFAFGGEHDFGRFSLDWQASYAKASEERPDERYIDIVAETDEFSVDITNPEKPFVSVADWVSRGVTDNGEWELDELTEEYQYTEDIDTNFALNLKYRVSDAVKLKFGGRLRDKSKKRNNEFYEYEPVDNDAFMDSVYGNLADLDKEHFLAGDKYLPGNFASSDFIGSLDLDSADFEKEEKLEELAENFTAKEQIKAVYAMATWDATEKIRVIGGVRMEHTRNEYDAFFYDDDADTLTPVSGTPKEYTNVLPYIHLLYRLDDRTNIRCAYTHSLARPDYFDLAPYRQLDDDAIYIGNPSLEPTLSKNIDLIIERYLGNVGILSAGLFYKDISDFIVTRKTTVADDDIYQPVNGGDGSLSGIELSAQFQMPFLKGLGLYLNYTYTDSGISNFNIEGRETDDLPLPGSPEHTFNASLSYEKGPFTIRLSGNYHSDFIDSEEGSIGEDSWEDRYYDSSFTLDLNGAYRLSKELQLFFEISNLSNQPMRFYQGEKQYVAQEEWYDRKFLLGLKADF
ncbi:MAG: TonB-dependent receptor [Chlorobium sp.]|uniref:TonB-dependent receptor n=1 Tax=Chlorobium sp. TaxID=1095 RepID=UPI0025C633F3|nr:TonB-dependent receptor [Chlorobium sp.]MCF8217332.1 TonB-dependent receptor [Chlorobium sp.]MCF8272176.1 TonB-dependent receptor [Chlorobium sp.]MCF8288545.1 TonB-dependent receptor [Chlorobium sp.]MCF8292139.1 TonB-dependent receptor [Chlorobium sp.]MCF8386216.1 TonB-dependent receptor [Chlorobium sp.]